ncbi:unnamed protein product [Rotaria sp. Silwood2]|nr:unnamed protein product [Rotaria sp. Silwood2]CAF3072331.1 unnamed protein product [Rotaria sp. Silwood2]CAF3078584.1 unnamed protein product [Rotaria sp. Silwood2]CAF3304928.1 unnamed protein product [Rotaria sp. Silwood2]CAF4172296.1 unnamed protein product [Rotaria sp. Silwood2]
MSVADQTSMMQMFKMYSLVIYLMYAKGQMREPSEYPCVNTNFTVTFTLSDSSHSAWKSSSNCSLSQCSTNNNSCRLSMTPCFDYHTINNISYCAPASLCSILETCDNITHTCSSSASVCVVNSCCVTKTICLPLSWTTLCTSESLFFVIKSFSIQTKRL